MKIKRIIKLNFLFLIFINLTFINCSKSESEENECNTFLECHEGSVWNVSFESNNDYLTFLNNSNIVFQVYSKTNTNCFNIYNASDAFGSFPISLMENTKNKLIFKINGNDQYRIETLTYTNEIITYNIKTYVNEKLVEDETQTLTKQNVELNGLTICN